MVETPFWSDSIVFNKNIITSVIAALTLGVNGPLTIKVCNLDQLTTHVSIPVNREFGIKQLKEQLVRYRAPYNGLMVHTTFTCARAWTICKALFTLCVCACVNVNINV